MRAKNSVKLFLLCLILNYSTITTAQEKQQHEHNFSCGHNHPTNEYFDMMLYKAERRKEINILRNAVANNRGNDSTLVIPIVFHVIHEYGSENITDDQVKDAVRILNEDFAKLNADTSAVSSAFDTLIGNANIEFRLAQLDFDGNCTNGIEHIFSLETRNGDDDSKMRLKIWPRDRYLNIWIVNSMQAGVAGYAYYPSATTGPGGYAMDGVIIKHEYIGSIGTGSVGLSRALTHEIGHYLGLSHTWGSNNNPGVACSDDLIQDTPETMGWTTCNLTTNDICNPGIEENVQNFMEYSYCSNMFTMGQAAAMRSILHEPTAFRNKLWSATTLALTGVDQTTPVTCAPIADFIPEKRYICTGESISLFDYSFNGDVTSWEWSIPGATPSSSAQQFPSVTFNNPGQYTITLISSNAAGSDTAVITNAVIVNPDAAQYQTHIESFEAFNSNDAQLLYPAYSIGMENELTVGALINATEQNIAYWELASDAGASGSKSLRLDAYQTNDKMIDEFITPAYDLRYLSSGSFTFKFSSTSSSGLPADRNAKLRIYSSTNCGKTWSLRKQINDLDLVNAGMCGVYYVPNQSDAWETVYVPINGSLMVDNVRFKFEYVSGTASNNIYIDDIGIEGILSAENINAQQSFSIYPNPSGDVTNVQLDFQSNSSDNISMSVYNTLGQKVSTGSFNVKAGNNTIILGSVTEKIQSTYRGVLIIKLDSKVYGTSYTQRLVIE